MPQPLSSFGDPGLVIIGNVGHDPFKERPDLALLVVNAIASWSNVESFHLNFFMKLLGGPGEKAADIYLALEARSARSAAIHAAAQSLPKSHKNLLRAVLAISSSRRKIRDKMAHGIWGISSNISDALLLASPSDLIIHGHDLSKIFVYRKRELQQIITDNERLVGYGQLMGFIISGNHGDQDDPIFRQLSAEAEIAEKLRHLVKQDQNTQ